MSWRASGCFLFLLAASVAAGASPVPVGGTVLDDQGRPVAGAQVEILRLSRPYADARTLLGFEEPKPVAMVVSDVDGRFQGSVPEEGMWRLRVQARGFLAQQVDDLPLLESAELPTVSLKSARPLRVRVVDAEGRPVVGARVRAVSVFEDTPRPGTGFAYWRPPPRLATTGRDGTALLPGGDLGILVTAWADGFLEEVSKDLNPGTTAITLRLSPGCRRTVQVLSPRHQPAPGALLQSGRWSLGLSGAEGRAEVTVSCQGEAPLYLLTPDGRRSREVIRPTADPAVALRFALPPRAAKLAGRVLDATSRQPVAGALVWPSDQPAAFVRTDALGRYRVQAPARQDAQLVATADGSSFAAAGLVARPGEGPRPGPTLYLRPAKIVAARVIDETKRPVAGARARIAFANRNFLARSDAQGNLRLKLSGSRELVEAWVTHPDFLQAHVWLRSSTVRRGKPLEIVLRRGARALATVVDPEGQPVAGATGLLTPWSETEATERTLQADGNGQGTLAFTPVAPGKYNLLVRAPGWAPLEIPGVVVSGSGESQDWGTFRMEPGARLEGRVVDPQNLPIAGAAVARSDPWTGSDTPVLSGADGRFALTAVRAGERIPLMAWKDGYVARSLGAVEVPLPEPLTIVLAAAHRIAGSIRDEAGAPVQDALLFFHSKTPLGGSMMSFPQEIHDPEGRFEVLVDDPGTGSLTVSAQGYLVKEINVEVPQEGGVENLDIVLEATSSVVVGTLTGPEGEPIAEAWIVFGRQGGPAGSSTPPLTDSAGAFRAEGLFAGSWIVYAQPPGYRPLRQDLEVREGENRVDFRLERGLEVEGEVVDTAGRPVPGARLSLTAKEGPRPGGFAVSDESGRFLIQGVESGDFTLFAQSPGFPKVTLDVSLAESPVRGLRLVLEPGGALRGRLVGLDAQELLGAQVTAAQPSSDTAATRADYRGGYELRGLAPGEWTVSARTASGRDAQGTVTLPTGAGEAVCDLEFTPGWTLSGRVRLSEDPNSPSPTAVRAWSDSEYRVTALSPFGEFRFEALPAGTFQVEVLSGDGKVLAGQDVELQGDRDVEIEPSP